MEMKQVHSTMEDTNNQILYIIKRQRTLANSERAYMSIQAIYLNLHVMAKDDPTRNQIVPRMVETTLTANGMNGGGNDRGYTGIVHRNEREVGLYTRNTNDVQPD